MRRLIFVTLAVCGVLGVCSLGWACSPTCPCGPENPQSVACGPERVNPCSPDGALPGPADCGNQGCTACSPE